jgi:ABC-2 type transport system ATP-binding protein
MTSMEDAMSIVEVFSLTKRYGTLTALDNCTLSVRRGEISGLLGPNGAGKTTLLRLLMGFLRPTSGRATIAGRDCYRDAVAVHRDVSYLPGDVRLFRGIKGREVLSFVAQLRGHSHAARSFQLADRLGLDLSRPVAQLSTGMRQKLALAAVLSEDAPLLMLDEPTSNLDATVLAVIREAKSAGRTVIFSSHILSEVEHVCDRVVILKNGLLVHDQVMAEIRRRHRIRARLTGALPPPPENLAKDLAIMQNTNDTVTIETPGELSPLLGWLASLPLAEVRIEPLGLPGVYEQYHPLEHAA